MGDSDDEFDRKKGRDKFRRERNDYDRSRSDDRRRDNWEDRRPSMRGGQRGWRGNSNNGPRRDDWSRGRGSNNRDRRDMYTRSYDDRRRDRFSPGRFDNGQGPAKRMRRDWEDGGYSGGMYESPFQVSNGPPQDRWQSRGMDNNRGPPDRGDFSERRDVVDPDYPTQPPMMSFKQFLNKQDDSISQDEAIKLFEEYKLDFKKQQINEFFLAHKEEEWFKMKYHPEETDKRQVEVRAALEARRKVFETLREKKFLEGVMVDEECTAPLIKIMDAAVILLEGGNDLDLTILDVPPEELEEGERSRQNSESNATAAPSSDNVEKKENISDDDEDGEISDSNDKKKEVDEDDKDKDKEKKPDQPKDLTLEITPEQEELKKKAMEYQKEKEAAEAEAKAQRRKKKNLRKKSDYSYESDSESGSESDSDPEPAPPGLEDDDKPPGAEPSSESKDKIDETGDNVKKENGDVPEDNKEKEEKEKEDEVEKPRPLHRTNSIFLRNLAPTITKQEVEAMCRRYPGFIRVALQDPQPERRFLRRGWLTFSKTCNIKDVCWTLNNIRLKDCELGATLNRELKQRIRMANGLAVHKQVMKNDIKMAAKIIQILDKKWNLWEEEGEEKKDEEKELQIGFIAKNPVLKNITDFLVDEGSFEEEELIGQSDDDKKDTESEITVERDVGLCRALDRMILYLRLVHSIDYYAANEYPNEDEMPHRCGIMHARGEPPGPTSKMTQSDVNEWMASIEKKIKPFMEAALKISDKEANQLGQKDPDSEVEKFVQSNTSELSKDKWLCPLSGKKFKGPDFVRKHLFNKHAEKVDEVRKEVKYFNNYLVDPKRPGLPEHPSSRPKPPPPAPPAAAPQQTTPQQPAGAYGNNFTSPMGGYTQGRPPMYGSGGAYSSPFAVRDSRPPDQYRRNNYGGSRPYRRSDPRQLIQYTDLDQPDDGDIF